MIKERDLDNVGQFIINELAKELIKQDHSATGKLIDSLDYRTTSSSVGQTLLIEMLDYGKFVNTGRKKGARKVPIQALVDWIKQKGIATNNKKALGIAFAIQKTIEKEGSPTIRSRRNGKKTEFVDDTLERIESDINRRLEEAAFKTVEVQIDNLVKRI